MPAALPSATTHVHTLRFQCKANDLCQGGALVRLSFNRRKISILTDRGFGVGATRLGKQTILAKPTKLNELLTFPVPYCKG